MYFISLLFLILRIELSFRSVASESVKRVFDFFGSMNVVDVCIVLSVCVGLFVGKYGVRSVSKVDVFLVLCISDKYGNNLLYIFTFLSSFNCVSVLIKGMMLLLECVVVCVCCINFFVSNGIILCVDVFLMLKSLYSMVFMIFVVVYVIYDFDLFVGVRYVSSVLMYIFKIVCVFFLCLFVMFINCVCNNIVNEFCGVGAGCFNSARNINCRRALKFEIDFFVSLFVVVFNNLVFVFECVFSVCMSGCLFFCVYFLVNFLFLNV